jgi:anti-anti-sigma regulatory factor
MDQSLLAHVKLDVVSDVVRIDVRGSLTQASRPTLIQIIQRVRRRGITSHISVDLGRAAFVESSALAGLRNDLNSIDDAGARSDIAGMPAPGGVSLELTPHGDDSAAFPALDMSGEFLASVDTSGTRQLTRFSDEELLAASDSVFGLLDDPADMARSELLATYDEIGIEISRRQVGRDTEPA